MNVHLRANVFNFFLQIITSSRVDKNGKMFYTRRIYTFYVIWLTQCFLHLKISSVWRIYTSMRVFFHIFFWKYLPLCKLTIMVFLQLQMLSTWTIYTSTWAFFLLQNILVRVDFNGVSYTWICFLPEEYTPLYTST